MNKYTCTACVLMMFAAIAILCAAAPSAPQEQQPALRIFLRSGPKTHGPATNGLHDGPTFLKEWQPLLEARAPRLPAPCAFPPRRNLSRRMYW